MTWLAVKNWSRFQHYKGRRPPWIKMYPALLEDPEFRALPDASKLLAMCSMMLASKHDGRVPDDIGYLTSLGGIAATQEDLETLVTFGLLQRASNVLAEKAKRAMPETERETETERDVPKRKSSSQRGRGGTPTALKDLIQEQKQHHRLPEEAA